MQKIAIVGLGSMGKNHYNVLKNIPNASIVGLCDVAKQEGYEEDFFTNLDEMLSCVKPDALIIVTPTFLHKETALCAIKHGVHFFLEKPAASSVEQTQEILDALQKSSLKSCVGHIERFNPVVKALMKEINAKEILSINITRSGAFPQRITDVGILTDLSVHDSDLLRFISKKEILKKSVLSSQKIHPSHEDNAILSFVLEGEVIASIQTNWLTPYTKRSINVICRDEENTIISYEADLLTQTLQELTNVTNNTFRTKNCFVKRSNALEDELLAFLEYLQTGERGSLATLNDSKITLEVAHDS